MAMTHLELTQRAFTKLDLPRGSVLDVGCWHGDLKYYFIDRGYSWVGLDAHFDNPNMPIHRCYMEDMNIIKDKTFDIVFCSHSLEHCSNPIQALMEFRRIMKDDGHLFISTPMLCPKQLLEDADHIFVLTQEQMSKLFNYCGYRFLASWVEGNTSVEDSSIIYYVRKIDNLVFDEAACPKCGKIIKRLNKNFEINCCKEIANE